MARIEAPKVKGSVFHTDECGGFNGLERFGNHAPIDHSETYADGPATSTAWRGSGATPRACTGPATGWTGRTSPSTWPSTNSGTITVKSIC